VVEDIASIPRPSLADQALLKEGIRAYVNVPLVSRGELVGTLNLAVDRPGIIAPEYVDVATGVAGQLAIAIQQARLYKQVQHQTLELEQRVTERTRRLATLYDVTAVASDSLDLHVILERALERMLQVLRCPAGAVHLLDDAGKELHLAVHRGLSVEFAASLDPLPADRGLLNDILNQGDPVVLSDLANEPRIPKAFDTDEFHVWVGAPMRAKGLVLGIFSLFGEAGQQFSIEDVTLLTSVADHVGVAAENTRLRQMAERAAALAERERLARELHDSVTQSLFSLTLFTEAAREQAKSRRMDQVWYYLDDIDATAHQVLKELRLMLFELRPPVLEEAGLVGALRHRLDAVETRVGMEGRILTDVLTELPAPVEEALYRIALEALNNSLKHAQATSVTVHLYVEADYVVLEVFDNGRGFDLKATSRRASMGLTTMQERAETLGGSLILFSQPGQGTKVQVRVPTQAAKSQP
jgi:signal transduction histidine kinase